MQDQGQARTTAPGQAAHDGGHPDSPEDAAFRISPKIEDWIGVIVMGLLVLITFANVVVRYFTNDSFAWTEEFSVFLMIVLALVAGSAAVARDRHIRIEFFFERGSKARQHRLAIFSALCVAAMFVALAILGGRVAWDEYRFEETSPGIGVPSWWYSVWLPVFSAAIALRAGGVMVRHVRQLKALAAQRRERGDA
ncbi:TRAP transporter small permease [Uliginosibacterium sp. sgz301328]|uniref:TRAP transporter small permease n=1 Tax=Uliginosibacterium sp. sgz301328 TaxID=3243764 RepID=UPI00359D7DF9